MPKAPDPKSMEIIEKPLFRSDYEMGLVDDEWLKGAVKPKRFIDFIPEQCILCEGCVDICPWYCIFMLSPDAVEQAGNVALSSQMEGEDILFLIDDNACTRCNLCVERCPTGALVQSEVAGGKKRGGRAMGTVPGSQKA
ncbi:MAG: 4Fe-4S dicluster domain-containing protein [Actinobacteria bacterium]|nr:4Fe-4S dicluster domain-containing protein [Actinomycetota bacterium]